jgi:hypothetical protein
MSQSLIKYSIVLTLATIFIFSCRKSEEDQMQKELDINYLRFDGRYYLEKGMFEEAEDAYKKLAELVPNDPSINANLALVYLAQNKYKEAKSQITKALKKDPDNPDIRMISAKYFELTQQPDKAIEELKKIIEKKPDYVVALYNLARMYEQSDIPDAAANREKYLMLTIEKAPSNIVPRLDLISLLIKSEDYTKVTPQLEELPKIFAEFPKEANEYYKKTMDALHASDTAAAKSAVIMMHNFLKVTIEYQSDLRELKGPEGELVGLSLVSLGDFEKMYADSGESILNRIRFLDITAGMNLNPSTEESPLASPTEETLSRFTLGDYNDDGYVDVYFSSSSSNNSTSVRRLMSNIFGNRFQEQINEAGINHDGRESASLFSDYDNDGYLDLYIVKKGPNVLYRNKGESVFSNVASDADVDDSEAGNKPFFFDADHDGDLDLLVTRPSTNLLYRNNANGKFSEMADAMGFGAPVANCTDAAFTDFDEDGDLDLFLTSDKGPNVLFSNDRHGKFSNITTVSGLQDSKFAVAVAAADYNNDGFTDLLLLYNTPEIAGLYTNKGDGTFVLDSSAWMSSIKNHQPKDAVFFDFDNDGLLDLLIAGKPTTADGRGLFLFHNDSKGSFNDVSDLLPSSGTGWQQIETDDFDKDGDLDIFAASLDGKLHVLQNEGGNLNHYLKIQLVGLRAGNNKNNHFGIGSKVEIRAGELYQMKVVTEPVLHFGLGSRLKADVIRVVWTNGVAQNKLFPGSDEDLLESEILKGSCAFLYTWDGEKYVFCKDMMWRSALGMPLGIMGTNTEYAPADPSKEYLKIPGEQMKLQNGKYIIQVTEELWEAAYFDNLELVVIDHPQSEVVFVDERFTMPPYSDQYELYAVQNKVHPVKAVDGAGTNLLPQILKKDDNYISNFRLGEYQGITETHDLVLDPGKDLHGGNVLLFLNGWIFPSDASINYSLGQSSKLKVIPPQLQVVDGKGEWVTVIENMGFPMGKDKMMIVDLSGKYLSKERRVRIRTNMEIYWDEIFFSSKTKPEEIKSTRLKPSSADLHYRGFSQLYRKGGRYGPHWFDYSEVSTGQKWRDLTGYYTHFGEVSPLLSSVDDKLVIMNSGDEMTVTFDASKLPPLPSGWKRDFLIYSEGWIKDGDLNTAHGKSVDPLPFHGMTSYPYGDDELFPSDAEHLDYLKNYNTREVNIHQFRREIMEYKPPLN